MSGVTIEGERILNSNVESVDLGKSGMNNKVVNGGNFLFIEATGSIFSSDLTRTINSVGGVVGGVVGESSRGLTKGMS